jgi:hypothetical protein
LNHAGERNHRGQPRPSHNPWRSILPPGPGGPETI